MTFSTKGVGTGASSVQHSFSLQIVIISGGGIVLVVFVFALLLVLHKNLDMSCTSFLHFWHVSFSIKSKELLAEHSKRRGFLDAKKYKNPTKKSPQTRKSNEPGKFVKSITSNDKQVDSKFCSDHHRTSRFFSKIFITLIDGVPMRKNRNQTGND